MLELFGYTRVDIFLWDVTQTTSSDIFQRVSIIKLPSRKVLICRNKNGKRKDGRLGQI